LSAPKWYQSLGSTAKERQKNYRVLFRDYLKCTGWIGTAGNRTQKEELSQCLEQKFFRQDVGSRKFLELRQIFYLKYLKIKEEDRNLSPSDILDKFLEAT